jgi:hypothetical protein
MRLSESDELKALLPANILGTYDTMDWSLMLCRYCHAVYAQPLPGSGSTSRMLGHLTAGSFSPWRVS